VICYRDIASIGAKGGREGEFGGGGSVWRGRCAEGGGVFGGSGVVWAISGESTVKSESG